MGFPPPGPPAAEVDCSAPTNAGGVEALLEAPKAQPIFGMKNGQLREKMVDLSDI